MTPKQNKSYRGQIRAAARFFSNSEPQKWGTEKEAFESLHLAVQVMLIAKGEPWRLRNRSTKNVGKFPYPEFKDFILQVECLLAELGYAPAGPIDPALRGRIVQGRG